VATPIIETITLRRLALPLRVPYVLSYHTFETFEPIVVEVAFSDGSISWGEGHISPGSSKETREEGWQFVLGMSSKLLGANADSAQQRIKVVAHGRPVAATALTAAIEMANGSDTLKQTTGFAFPLLTPFNAHDEDAICQEVEERLTAGFRTLKIKVGKDVEADLRRLGQIQSMLRGRAMLRLDANRSFSLDQGLRFAANLDPTGIELFEQPCDADDWKANARVAAASPVPLMLDEPICSIADIERAEPLKNVGYCKLKLKRFGSIAGLEAGLIRVRELGMRAVLGDGLGADIACWMEACVAHRHVNNAGEFNGFLKLSQPLLANPLELTDGVLVVPAGYWPEIDRNVLANRTVEERRFKI
jgi:L-alanine-DL-glutamate epimerase-like enolase superfamily enzyme